MQELLQRAGVKDSPTTARNPQANAVCEIGDEVLIKVVDPNKLEPKAHGPYPVVATNTNGTIDVRRNPHVVETINIRRVVPFRR